MKPTFYPRLAWMGIKKNARLYVPYLLSCAFMAAMLYVIAYLAVTPALYTVNGKVNGSGTSAVAMTMSLGSFVVSVFIALFLFYTNSFLLRRRKKEFGLYSVLGMDRGALSAILFWETLLAAAFTLIAGLGLGLLLSYALAVRTAAAFISPRRGFHREPCRHQAVRHHVHRYLRAALCARCAVAAPRAGRGAFEERKRRRKAAEVAMAARHPRSCAAARRVLHRRDHQRPRTGDAALLPRGHHGDSIDVSSLHLRQRDALQNAPEGREVLLQKAQLRLPLCRSPTA